MCIIITYQHRESPNYYVQFQNSLRLCSNILSASEYRCFLMNDQMSKPASATERPNQVIRYWRWLFENLSFGCWAMGTPDFTYSNSWYTMVLSSP